MMLDVCSVTIFCTIPINSSKYQKEGRIFFLHFVMFIFTPCKKDKPYIQRNSLLTVVTQFNT